MTATTPIGLEAPKLPGVPLFGNVLDVWRDRIGTMVSAMRDHGSVVALRFGPFRYFLVGSAEGIRHVLIDNAKNYTKSRNYNGLKLVLGEGLITSEGDFWRRQRKLAQPAFHRERLVRFVQEMTDATGKMLDRWSATEPDSGLDVHAEMMALTLRIVARTLFGVDVSAEAAEVAEVLPVVIRYAHEYTDTLFHLPPSVPTPKNLRFRRGMRALDAIVDRIIETRRGADATGHDLLSMLMEATDEETGERMSAKQLRDELMTLILAGHETTASALSWTFILLSRHPDVARRVHAEVKSVLGDRRPMFEDLPRLTYTTWVIQESMRLYPPVWVIERQAIEADVIEGFRIPANSIVAIVPYALHRNPAYWENSEGFDPERFDPMRACHRPRHAYLPFGAGPRQCIGAAFAMMEAQLILAMVSQRWRLHLIPGHPVEMDPTITLRPRHPVRVTLAPP